MSYRRSFHAPLSVTIALSLLLAACSAGQTPASTSATAPPAEAAATTPQPVTPPKRIILFIGDGMGMGAISAAAYTRGEPLNMLGMPHVGLMTTHEHEFVTTDSAASATAIASGHKTHFQALSVTPGTTAETEHDPAQHLKTVVEWARESGLRTGLVATSRINHATPAAFASHRAHRRSYEAIAADLSGAGVDVLLGAGSRYFEQREDGRNLLEAMAADGYTVARTPAEVQAARGSASKLVGLLHEKDTPFVREGGRAMELPEMVDAALDVLDRDNDQGFFLMVEGSFVDWAAHRLDGHGVVAETLDLDRAVGRALTYADGRDDTLVVVTADHETGGLSVLDPPYVERFAKILGGEEGAAKRAALPPKSIASPAGGAGDEPRQASAPISYIGLATDDPSPAPQPRTGAPSWGMDEILDSRLSLAFTYLSLASRTYWTADNDFSATHTSSLVPIFARGQGAEYVAAADDNAELGDRLIALVRARAGEPAPQHVPTPRQTRPPKNVILMVGDGMGVNPLTAAIYTGGDLAMRGMPVKGLVSTHSVDRLVNDSAASASALATGHRTRRGSLGTRVEAGELVDAPSLLERAEARGLSTGLVSTTQITHATPAAFYAHVPDRGDSATIAGHFLSLPERIAGSDGVDVAFAGGAAHVGAEQRAALEAMGYTVATSWPPPTAPQDGRLVALLAEQGLPAASLRMRDGDPATPTLAEMTAVAIDRLEGDDDGFFLLVEGGQIDWALHSMKRDQTVPDEVRDFDDAVAAALAFAREDGETLVLVTADHDHTLAVFDTHYFVASKGCGAFHACGGPEKPPELPVALEGIRNAEGFGDTALQGDYGAPRIILDYAWLVMEASRQVDMSAPHSANFVPLFAEGPWAARFTGFQDQPEVGAALQDWLR